MLDDRTLFFLIPSIKEVVEAFSALTYPDVAVALSVILWLVVLAIPLTGIDRRERMAGYTYVAFMAFSAAALVFAAPARLKDWRDAALHVVVILVMGVLAGARWSLRKKEKVAL